MPLLTIPIVQNKQAIIGIAVAVLILFGAGGFFLYNKSKPAPAIPAPKAANEEQQNSNVSGNILEILKSGQTQQCSFTSSEENTITNGTFYISNQQFRADFDITRGTDKSSVSMIRKGNENYIWGSSFPNNTGLKMTLSVDEFAEDEQTKDYFNTDEEVDYTCKPWVADTSKFNPPSNIKFTDFSGLIPTGVSTTGSSSASSQCSVCNSLTGDAKTACLSGLNCQ